MAVLGTILATLYAYAMTRVALPWKRAWHFIALLPTISPPILMALSLILLYGRRGLITHEVLGLQTSALYGFRGLVVAQLLSYFPFAYLLLLNLFRGLDASLEEAASTMGAHPGKVLSTVSLPLLMPGLGGAALLLFGYSLADLGNPLLLGGDFQVLSSQIYQTIIGMYDVPKGAALAVILLLPALLLFFAHKQLAAKTGFASVGGRGTLRHPQMSHPMVKAGALLLLGGVSLVIVLQYATVSPGRYQAVRYRQHLHLALLRRRGHRFARCTDRHDRACRGGIRGHGSRSACCAAYYIARTRFVGRNVLDFVANLPLAIPGTVDRARIRARVQSPTVASDRHCVHHRHGVHRALAPLLGPLGSRHDGPAASLPRRGVDEHGRDERPDAVRVLLPLLRPALVASMIFTFTRSVTTLSAVIFVVSPHWSLVTPAILSQMDRGDVGEAAALSIILVVVVLAVIHGVPRLLGRDWRAQA